MPAPTEVRVSLSVTDFVMLWLIALTLAAVSYTVETEAAKLRCAIYGGDAQTCEDM